MISATIFEAKTNLSELIKRAQAGDKVVITNGGRLVGAHNDPFDRLIAPTPCGWTFRSSATTRSSTPSASAASGKRPARATTYTHPMHRALLRALALFLLIAPVLPAQQPLQLAITFDDLPAHGPLPPGEARPQVVQDILATLQREHMPPTYGFVNAFRLAAYPYQVEILRAWLAAGNPLGNHTYDHPALDTSTAAAYEADIARDEPVLRRLDPHGDWRWFRFPYLQEGETAAKHRAVHAWLVAHHYRVAEVTMDFEDYMWNDTYGRCAAQHDTAAIQSLHDSYLATADEYITYSRTLSQRLYRRDIPYVLLLHVGAFDARMLPDLLALYRRRGFQFVTLPQAEADPAYATDPAVGYPGGGLLTELQAVVQHINPPDATEPEAELDRMCRAPKVPARAKP